MMEDCATGMSASQGCIDDKLKVEQTFRNALKGRIGEDRYRMWFAQGVELEFIGDQMNRGRTNGSFATVSQLNIRVRGQFALDRITQNFLQPLRGAAMQVCGKRIEVQLSLFQSPAEQSELPLDSEQNPNRQPSNQQPSNQQPAKQKRSGPNPRSSTPRKHRGPRRLSSLVREESHAEQARQRRPAQLQLPACESDQIGQPVAGAKRTTAKDQASPAALTGPALQSHSPTADFATNRLSAANFVAGICNQLAYTAMGMVCQTPTTASPLFLCGPTGTGKTHLLSAIAEQFRRRHRMRRVMQLSAEQFTNDFITSVGNSGITAFRRRYREVDALLIDDVQFLGAKKATLREMLYTVETLATAGRPLIFSGLHAPTEIQGLSRELAGRMAAGLVCGIQPLDAATRETILRRWFEARCKFPVTNAMLEQINATLQGDGRVLSGVVNVVNTLQRMFGRNPTMEELRKHAGGLLRSAAPVANLNVIEAAVCQAFQLEPATLRGGSQTRAVTEPRMLAMYLSRQLTSSAYSQIATHFGGRSHSTAISAENNVKSWLASGKSIGRGAAAISVREAIDRIEGLMRSG